MVEKINKNDGTIKFRENESGKMYEIEIYYSLGGINYFSGSTNRRGVYISIKPIDINGNTIQYTVLGSEKESGLRMLLQELPRKSVKSLFLWADKIRPHFDEIINTTKKEGVREALAQLRNFFDIKN